MSAVSPRALAECPLFAGLGDDDLEVVAHWLDAEGVDVGRRLTHQGRSGYAFFVLASGTADVIVDDEVVRLLGPGDFFGEISMFEDGRQTATVQVTSPGEVWAMFGTRFRELEQEYPAITATLERTARARRHGAS